MPWHRRDGHVWVGIRYPWFWRFDHHLAVSQQKSHQETGTPPMFPVIWNPLLHFVQDMYDLSLNCFRELADRIDDLALEISTKRERLAGTPRIGQEEPMVPWISKADDIGGGRFRWAWWYSTELCGVQSNPEKKNTGQVEKTDVYIYIYYLHIIYVLYILYIYVLWKVSDIGTAL